MIQNHFSTGIAGLDRVFRGLLPGDNLVWHIDEIDDFLPFAPGYCSAADKAGKRLIYLRFAEHAPLVSASDGVEVREIETAAGFERFITEVRATLREAGRGAFFLFDCISFLSEIWASDRMLGNFFMLSCPYVYDMESMAYFPLMRGLHSSHAMEPITRTTQILTEVYRHHGIIHVQPSKVEHRYSSTMYMLHAWEGAHFTPISDSATIAEILTERPWPGLDAVRFRLGKWNRVFLESERIRERQLQGKPVAKKAAAAFRTLLTMLFSRDEQVVELAGRYLDLGDLLAIWRRMIGTGLIGGKSVGMLLARAILRRTDARWGALLEPHDSFFIGSDIYYSYLVENGCWLNRHRQHYRADDADDLHEARRRIIIGRFPDDLIAEFAELLDYFSQSPIIVRSSSLLEDSYGNAFAGKYESVFCANQGPHQKRLDDFIAAVKTIYASTLSEKAMRYRAQRGLLDRDEQMSLLVQRVSGSRHDTYFFPFIAGVGLSRNPYVWNPLIDPKAGMVRLVFGLGTRAVDRSDDDYTRVVALNVPRRRPESDAAEVRQYSQRHVDLIDLDASQVLAVEFSTLAGQPGDLPLDIVASPDQGIGADVRPGPLLLTFDRLLSQTQFVSDMREMLRILEAAYAHPVDMEFTANFKADGSYRVNLVQCRPLQIATDVASTTEPAMITEDNLLIASTGAVIGTSRQHPIERVVYVTPSIYSQLTNQDRYAVARLVGRILHAGGPRSERRILLAGPGRWGTTTPSLGVPVGFAEIDTVAVLCEIVTMHEGLIPDVSLGTHFFNDLVEMDILYLALFPERTGHVFNQLLLEQAPNRLTEILPEAARWSAAVRVIDAPLGSSGMTLWADALEQRVMCYLDAAGPVPGTELTLLGADRLLRIGSTDAD